MQGHAKKSLPAVVTSVGDAQRELRFLATGLRELDGVISGFPRGAVTEIVGADTSGKTSLVQSLLVSATRAAEMCAYVDTSHTFDPTSAASAGVRLSNLIWVRCRGSVGVALRVTDSLLQAGGLGVVALDIGQVKQSCLNVLRPSNLFRLRRAVEETQTILAIVTREPVSGSGAALRLELKRRLAVWEGKPGFHLLSELQFDARSQRHPGAAASLRAKAF
jgi:recombination protein RecA